MNKLLEKQFKSIEIFTIAITCACSLIFIFILFFVRWPKWWELTIPELSPLSWMQTLLLFLIAITGFLCAMLCYLESNTDELRWWSFFGTGFILLIMDDRFAIHERLRDSILAPRHIKIPIFFWTEYGDFILLIYLIIGLYFGCKMLRIFRQRKSAVILFLAATAVSITAVLLDSFSYAGDSLAVQRIEQFVEELLEIGGMLCFFGAVFLMFSCYLRKLVKDSP